MDVSIEITLAIVRVEEHHPGLEDCSVDEVDEVGRVVEHEPVGNGLLVLVDVEAEAEGDRPRIVKKSDCLQAQ